ncbi:hypothetical protein FGO68_gene10322 [Halteria grandinella]|uniref:Uncharacterized protein n=1 Tax=Halteria grandinella TaxID=5974 RepID=A0A8J8SWM3_HALGN|nr:hypothetical protein FGO68_gene10322 [Halteria grandinella]
MLSHSYTFSMLRSHLLIQQGTSIKGPQISLLTIINLIKAKQMMTIILRLKVVALLLVLQGETMNRISQNCQHNSVKI